MSNDKLILISEEGYRKIKNKPWVTKRTDKEAWDQFILRFPKGTTEQELFFDIENNFYLLVEIFDSAPDWILKMTNEYDRIAKFVRREDEF